MLRPPRVPDDSDAGAHVSVARHGRGTYAESHMTPRHAAAVSTHRRRCGHAPRRSIPASGYRTGDLGPAPGYPAGRPAVGGRADGGPRTIVPSPVPVVPQERKEERSTMTTLRR